MFRVISLDDGDAPIVAMVFIFNLQFIIVSQ